MSNRMSSRDRIRILHVLGNAQREGTAIAKLVAGLCDGLSPSGFEFSVAFLGDPGPLSGILQQSGIQVWSFRWRSGWRYPLTLAHFCRKLLTGRFHIVHQHTGGKAPIWIARHVFRMRTILHVHSHLSEEAGLVPISIDGAAADRVVATSQAVACHVVNADPVVVYPGVELPACSKVDERGAGESTVVGAAGRLAPMKGFLHLIRAFALVHSQMAEARLEIAGSGPEEQSLRAEIEHLRLNGVVVLLGWRNDLSIRMRTWDLYVQPSLREPFGMAALEASAAGLAVIATAGAGLAEVVEDGVTGLLVPPADPPALAVAIMQLLRNCELRLQLGAAGRCRAQQEFGVNKMARQMEAVYDSLI